MRILPLFLALLVGCEEVAQVSDASASKTAKPGQDEGRPGLAGGPSLEERVASLEAALKASMEDGAEAEARIAELEGATGPDLSGFATNAQVAELAAANAVEFENAYGRMAGLEDGLFNLEDDLFGLEGELANLAVPAPAGAQIHSAEGTCSWDQDRGAPSAVLNVGSGVTGFQVLGANGNAWDEYSEVWAIHQDLDGTLEVICSSLGNENRPWAAKWRATWWTAQ